MRLLVVDDEYYFRKAMIQSLPFYELGIEECLEAEDGIQALSIVKEVNPEVILADINMPKMNGLEFIRQVREYNVETKIIIISGYDKFEYAQQAISYNITSYLLKPVDEEQLKEILKKVVIQINFERSKEAVNSTNKKDKEEISQYFLKQLVHAKKKEQAQEAALKLHKLTKGYLAVCIKPFTVENTEFKLIHFIITNVLNEKLSEVFHAFYSAREEDLIVYVFGNIKKSDLLPLTNILKTAQEFVTNNYGFHTCIGIGSIREAVEFINCSYDEALKCVLSRLYWSENHIIDSTDEFNYDFHIDKEITENLVAAVYKKDASVASNYLDTMFQSMKRENISVEQLRILMWEFLSQFESIIFDDKVNLEESIKIQCLDLIKLIHISFDYEEIRAKTYELCDLLCQKIEYKINGYPENVNRVLKIIEEEYGNPELSVSNIASRIFMNYNYLCVLFKKNLGVTINDYILKYRMKKASELLQNGGYKLNEIAEKTGFQNANYFGKCFKKEYGVSPSQYCKRIDKA